MNRTLSLNFRRLADSELSKLARIILDSMNDNEHFPQAKPILQKMREKYDQYLQAVSDAGGGDIAKASFKNDYREELINIMKYLGMHVIMEANGLKTPLISSGFPLAKNGGQAILSLPKGFKVMAGEESGEMILQIKRVIGAKSYIYQYTPYPLTADSVWQTVHGTTCKAVLQGLTPGVKYCFRMGAIGPRKQVVYTEVIERFVWF